MARKISEDDLKAITDQEIRNAVGYPGGKLSEARRKALYYYEGLPKGDLSPPEIEGRSTVVSTDVADTIEWMLPALLKIFTAGNNVVEFSPQNQDDEESAKLATEFINYIFYRQNPGFQILYTWFKDALLQKNGILKIWWDEKLDEAREEMAGITLAEIVQLQLDPEVEIIEATPRQATPEEMAADPMAAMQATMQGDGQPVTLFDVTLKRTKSRGRVRVENVPPEEFLISKRSKLITDGFCGHRVQRTMSDLKAMGYKNVDQIATDDTSTTFGGEAIERKSFNNETVLNNSMDSNAMDPSQRVVWVTECYMRVDYNGDGIAEWRKVTRAGNQLLDNEECDGPPFVSITPIPLPHEFFGLSIADLAMSVQQQKTAVMRAILDNLYLQVNGRYFAVNNQVNLDDLLTSRPGGVVRVQTPGAVGRLDQGMVDSGNAYQMLEYMETQKENRTGFTRYSQGNSADSLNKTATGINIVTNRSDARCELIARVFAETGVSDLFRMVLKLVSQHQDRAAQMQVNGKWLQVDPREWRNQFDMTINVGLGTGNKDQMVQHLMALLGVQREAVQMGLATPTNLYNSAVKLTENLGFKNADQFFTSPDDPQSPMKQPKPQPPPDPAMIKAQAQIEADRLKAMSDHQIAMGQLALKREQLEAEIALKREMAALQFGLDKETALYTALYKQSEAMVDRPDAGDGAGPIGPGAAGAPIIPGGGGYPPPVDLGPMGPFPGA